MSRGPDGPAMVLDKIFFTLGLAVVLVVGLSVHEVNGVNKSSSNSD
jgi:hypothetical protein